MNLGSATHRIAIKVEQRVGAVSKEDLEGALLEQEARMVQLGDRADGPALVRARRPGRPGRPRLATAGGVLGGRVPHKVEVQIGQAQRPRNHMLWRDELAGHGESDLHVQPLSIKGMRLRLFLLHATELQHIDAAIEHS